MADLNQLISKTSSISEIRLEDDRKQVKNLKTLYIVALTMIGLLTLFSQYLVRNAIQEQEADGRIINIAGRQRMLSQKISKCCMILSVADDETVRQKRFTELTEALEMWEKSHKGLQFGDAELKLPAGQNSQNVVDRFAAIQQPHNELLAAAQRLRTYFAQPSADRPEEASAAVKADLQIVLASEGPFLKGMNEIVFQYDDEAKAKVDALRTIEITLMIITILVLILEAMYVFRPVVKRIQRGIESLHAAQFELRESNEELVSLAEELKQNLEELHTTQEHLQQVIQKVTQSEKQLKEMNESVTDSIIYARRIQSAIFPSTEVLDQYFPNNFIFNKPKDIVSGDFYWFGETKSAFYMAVGDCTGHGVPGALMSVLGISELNAILSEFPDILPGEFLDQLNLRITRDLVNESSALALHDGMDLALIRVDKASKEISYAGANRPLLKINREGIADAVAPTRFPIGHHIADEKEGFERSFETVPLNLQKGDRIYLYSDGITDQFNDENRKFGKKNFYDLLVNLRNQPLDRVHSQIVRSLNEFKGTQHQTDDIIVVGVEAA